MNVVFILSIFYVYRYSFWNYLLYEEIFLNHQNIAFRLNLQVVCGLTVIFLCFGVYDYQSTKLKLYDRLNQQIEALNRRLDNSLPAALWNFESEFVQNILFSEADNQYVGGIYVEDNEGEAISGIIYNTSGTFDITLEKTDFNRLISDRVDGELSYHAIDVLYDKKPVGSIGIYSHDTGIKKLLYGEFWKILFQVILLDIILFSLMFVSLERTLFIPLRHLTGALAKLSQEGGDLTQRLDASKNNEIGRLSASVNLFIEQASVLIKSSVDMSKHLQEEAIASTQTSDIINQDITRQREEVDASTQAIVQMSKSAEKVTLNARETSNFTMLAQDASITAQKKMGSTLAAVAQLQKDMGATGELISELAKTSSSIGSVLAVIRGVAEQTNLLALNAAIEAARAGESGRGFAVVADEVRTLASRTQDSMNEIQEIIESFNHVSDNAVSSMRSSIDVAELSANHVVDVGKVFDEIVITIHNINSKNVEIAEAAGNQSFVIDEITNNMVNIARVADDTSERSSYLLIGMQKLKESSVSLEKTMSRFKV